MPRLSLLLDSERDRLLVLPQSQDDLIQQYSFTDADLALIRQRRGAANRLGFAVQMCLLRYPGYALASDTSLPNPVVHWIGERGAQRRQRLTGIRRAGENAQRTPT